MKRRDLMKAVTVAAGLAASAHMVIPANASPGKSFIDLDIGHGKKELLEAIRDRFDNFEQVPARGHFAHNNWNPQGYFHSHNPKAAGGPDNPGHGHHYPY